MGDKNKPNPFSKSGLTQRSPTQNQEAQTPKRQKINENETFNLFEMLNQINKNLENLNTRMKTLEDNLASENKIKEERIENLEGKIERLERENKEMRERWDWREREERKLNILVKNHPEGEAEDTTTWIKHFFEETLRDNPIEISKTERIGRKSNYPRPILVCLKKFEDKKLILENKKNICKKSDLYIEEDLTFKERRIKKFLLQKAREAKSENKKVRIMKYSILIQGTLYTTKENEDGSYYLQEIPKNDQN